MAGHVSRGTEGEGILDFHPYRSYVGRSEGTVAAIIVGLCVAVGVAGVVLAQVFA